ncbi:unnamed protein product [Hermetia illucens]|uniref:Uncharacterized protein n=1 Tax=Hermetia illucens TaxID=343691 RepID=A0A7R8UG70_HERIL|nr:unnamed protein product [Hermetia illucens]
MGRYVQSFQPLSRDYKKKLYVTSTTEFTPNENFARRRILIENTHLASNDIESQLFGTPTVPWHFKAKLIRNSNSLNQLRSSLLDTTGAGVQSNATISPIEVCSADCLN